MTEVYCKNLCLFYKTSNVFRLLKIFRSSRQKTPWNSTWNPKCGNYPFCLIKGTQRILILLDGSINIHISGIASDFHSCLLPLFSRPEEETHEHGEHICMHTYYCTYYSILQYVETELLHLPKKLATCFHCINFQLHGLFIHLMVGCFVLILFIK